MLSKLVKKYVSLLKNIPERHYWPIFVFLSLYFIVPVSEITVTVAAILYFKFEKRIAPVIQKLTKRVPNFFKYGGSILFFLVMIDDTLFYGLLIALAFWAFGIWVWKKVDTSMDRYALDAKWDILVGFWFEAVLVHQLHDALARPYRQFGSLGIDYTFGIGQGLTVLAEHLVLGTGEQPLEPADSSDYSAFSLRYRWGVVDEFSLILFSDWDPRQLYSFLEWRRTYDRWSLHLMVFANPQESQPSPFFPGSDLLAGTGLRALVVFNH